MIASSSNASLAGPSRDREKPGAKEGGGADLALLCPPEPLSRWIPRWAPKQKQSSLAPGFSRSPITKKQDKNKDHLDGNHS